MRVKGLNDCSLFVPNLRFGKEMILVDETSLANLCSTLDSTLDEDIILNTKYIILYVALFRKVE